MSTLLTPSQRDLFVGDETKYGQVIREMRATGAWFLPTLNGAPFTHKPPLHFWLIDALTYPLGIYSTWAFVLPSLVAFGLLLWLMWRMGGPLAAFVCATSLLVWGSAQTARMDVSFTLLIAYGAWMMQRVFDNDDRRAMLLCGVALGVATLIKGPMAPVIGVMLFVIEAWRRHRLPRVDYVLPLAAMIVIPLLWFVPAMMIGGGAYTREVIVKQTVGRAVASWVHNAPLWFYIAHLPLDVLPWFFVAIAALRRANRFYLSWMAAVLLPYSLMSSKLDVYMMALIPPMALMIAEHVARHASERWPYAITLLLFIVPALFVERIPAPSLLLFMLAAAALLALFTLRSSILSTIAVGIVPLVPLVCAAITMMPLINMEASTTPLIAALQEQHVAPEQIALYSCPYLWSRDFPRELERVRYVDADTIGNATVIATSRAHANEIAARLSGYQRVRSVPMIGKRFDVYRK